MVAHSSLQCDVTRSVIPWLWNSSSDTYWLFSVPLTCDKPFVPLVRFYALSHFGRPVSWCETFNRCFCRFCLFELGLVSFQVFTTPCRTCSACWEEAGGLHARMNGSVLLQLFPPQANPVTRTNLVSLLLFWDAPSPILIRTWGFSPLANVCLSPAPVPSPFPATLLPHKFISLFSYIYASSINYFSLTRPGPSVLFPDLSGPCS